jgi:hypothetical protein
MWGGNGEKKMFHGVQNSYTLKWYDASSEKHELQSNVQSEFCETISNFKYGLMGS